MGKSCAVLTLQLDQKHSLTLQLQAPASQTMCLCSGEPLLSLGEKEPQGAQRSRPGQQRAAAAALATRGRCWTGYGRPRPGGSRLPLCSTSASASNAPGPSLPLPTALCQAARPWHCLPWHWAPRGCPLPFSRGGRAECQPCGAASAARSPAASAPTAAGCQRPARRCRTRHAQHPETSARHSLPWSLEQGFEFGAV